MTVILLLLIIYRHINTKGYANQYTAVPRKLYKIGCNYNSTTGAINDWAVETATL